MSTPASPPAVREKPINCTAEEVRAFLDGRKTQKRFVVKPQPDEFKRLGPYGKIPYRIGREVPDMPGVFCKEPIKCPYEVGMRLWVRETWAPAPGGPCQPGNPVLYRADNGPYYDKLCWRSPMHMPRWASRITLEIVSVRVERLQEITARDILAEGAVERSHESDDFGKCPVSAFDGCAYMDLRSLWAAGWDQINGKRHGCTWADNPWVFVVSFRRV